MKGLFNVYTRQVNGHMSGAEGQADFYSLENVPYVMYFDQAILAARHVLARRLATGTATAA